MQAEIQELKKIQQSNSSDGNKRSANRKNELIPSSIAGRMEHGATREKIAGGRQMSIKMQLHSKAKWVGAHIVAHVNETGVRRFLCYVIVMVNLKHE